MHFDSKKTKTNELKEIVAIFSYKTHRVIILTIYFLFQIMVWHTRTQKNKPVKENSKLNIADSNIETLRQFLWRGVR